MATSYDSFVSATGGTLPETDKREAAMACGCEWNVLLLLNLQHLLILYIRRSQISRLAWDHCIDDMRLTSALQAVYRRSLTT